jgi:hypothetical protein
MRLHCVVSFCVLCVFIFIGLFMVFVFSSLILFTSFMSCVVVGFFIFKNICCVTVLFIRFKFRFVCLFIELISQHFNLTLLNFVFCCLFV